MALLARSPVCILVLSALLTAQTLRVPPSRTDRKTPALFTVLIDSAPGKPVVALQWEISVPPAVAIGKDDIAIGKAAESAGKLLTCAAKASKQSSKGEVRYACILAGGQNAILSGPIAVVHYRGQTDVHGAPIRVAIENVLGVSADLKRIEIPNVAAILEIR